MARFFLRRGADPFVVNDTFKCRFKCVFCPALVPKEKPCARCNADLLCQHGLSASVCPKNRECATMREQKRALLEVVRAFGLTPDAKDIPAWEPEHETLEKRYEKLKHKFSSFEEWVKVRAVEKLREMLKKGHGIAESEEWKKAFEWANEWVVTDQQPSTTFPFEQAPRVQRAKNWFCNDCDPDKYKITKRTGMQNAAKCAKCQDKKHDPHVHDMPSGASAFSLSIFSAPNVCREALNRKAQLRVVHFQQVQYLFDFRGILGIDKTSKDPVFSTRREREKIDTKKFNWETFYTTSQMKNANSKETDRSVLELMVENDRGELLNTRVMRRILDLQWNSFGRFYFSVRSIAFILTFCCAMGMTMSWPTVSESEEQPNSYWASYCWMVLCVGCSLHVPLFEWAESRHGLGAYLKQIDNWLDIATIVCLWMLAGCMIVASRSHPSDSTIEMVLWAIPQWFGTWGLWGDTVANWCASAIPWLGAAAHLSMTFKGLEYCAISPFFGPFVSIFQTMFKDIVKFFMIWFLFFVGFYGALGQSFDSAKRNDLPLLLFRWMLQQDQEIQMFDAFPYGFQTLARYLFLFYCVVCGVLLLNMLTAMMGTSFDNISEKATEEWLLRYADQLIKFKQPPRLLYVDRENRLTAYNEGVRKIHMTPDNCPPFDADEVEPESDSDIEEAYHRETQRESIEGLVKLETANSTTISQLAAKQEAAAKTLKEFEQMERSNNASIATLMARQEETQKMLIEILAGLKDLQSRKTT